MTSGQGINIQESGRNFLQLLAVTMQNQYVHEPTRGKNILDIFCTNNPFLVNSVKVRNTELSDHKLVQVSLSFDFDDRRQSEFIPDRNSFAALDFAKADYDSISKDIREYDWNVTRLDCTFEEFPEVMTKIFLCICQKHVPRRRPRTGKPRKYNALRRKKKRLEKRIAKTFRADVRTRLERKLALVHYEIKEAFNMKKDEAEKSIIQNIKSNPKIFYGYAKSHSAIRSDISMMRDERGQITGDYQKIANLLQDQFSSVYSNPESADKKDPDFPNYAGCPLTPECFKISEADIPLAAKYLKPNSAPGPDGIPSQLLTNCSNALAIPLTIMWEESFNLQIVPSFYKTSLVCPIYKKEDRTEPVNYHPISLTSHIMKTVERVVRRILVDYLESSNILSDSQHGFRSGRSTLTQLLDHFDSVLFGLVEGDDTDTIYLDYAKAFDKVDHQLLLKKMCRYGLPRNLVNWISSFLSDRLQTVVVKGFHSREAPVISGVPQGTVLGPVLFLIFINDLENEVVNSNLCFFADDTRISNRIKSMESKALLEMDLQNVMKWSRENNMELNQKKFELQSYQACSNPFIQNLPFSPQLYSYEISSALTLEPKCQLTDLGVLVTNDLSWSPHIASLVSKARGVAAWVLSVFKSRDPPVMVTLYKSLIRSNLEYCCPLWHPSKISDIELLEGVQREFTRKIYGYQDLSYWERLKKLNLSSLQRRRERYVLLVMWKILHRQIPNANVTFRPLSRLGIQAVVPGIVTSSRSAIQTRYDQSFSVIGPALWNVLPSQLTTIECQSKFKNRLSEFIQSLPDEPPVSGYMRAHANTLPEVMRRDN